MEATAKYDFTATAQDELSFKQGQRLTVLQTTGNWYKAVLDTAEGFVPKNYLNLELPSWYEEEASRSAAHKKLISQPMGAFLVRASTQGPAGHFSISVRQATDVMHFKVARDSRGHYYLWSQKFSSINQLVEYYKRKSISKNAHILLRETPQPKKSKCDILPTSPGPRPPAPPPTTPRPKPGPAPEPSPRPARGPPLAPAPRPAPEPTLGPTPRLAAGPPLGPPPRPAPDPTVGPTPRPAPGPSLGPPPTPALGLPPAPRPRPAPEPTPGPKARPAPGRTPQPALGPPPSQPSGTPPPTPKPKPKPKPKPTPTPTPTPAPRKRSAQRVRAVYGFHAEEADELAFEAGDVIEVLEHSNPSWWRGRLHGRSGLFPLSHTQPL